MGFDKHDRIEKILSILREKRRATVKELSLIIDTTEMTIRRDLKELDESGMIKRVYGGVLLKDNDIMEFSIEKRLTKNIEAKRKIGKKACDLIEDGDVIYLDPGTTCGEMVPYLATKKRLTIIINSSRLAYAFRNEQQHTIIMLGGEYRPYRMDIVGELAESMIEKLRGFKQFSGADGIDIELGLSANDITSASIARKIMESASQVIFIGDSSKFDNPSLYKIEEIDKLDYIVTEKELPKKWKNAAKENKIEIIYTD